jgi:hypothetical protein
MSESDRERIEQLFAALERVVDQLMVEDLRAALLRARRALDVDA